MRRKVLRRPVENDIRDVVMRSLVSSMSFVAIKESVPCSGADPDIFFSDRADDTLRALALCTSCPVVAECREWARANHVVGVWGGETDEARRRGWGAESRGSCKNKRMFSRKRR
ncbi:WhiB family transcriptional regulator [Streptomyces kronopolitis]|uniref:WhiB family transcriptional regulator n=1 Tax=Streptomyces kronopolitis TaxID=1612435 RepID=UPI00369368A6